MSWSARIAVCVQDATGVWSSRRDAWMQYSVVVAVAVVGAGICASVKREREVHGNKKALLARGGASLCMEWRDSAKRMCLGTNTTPQFVQNVVDKSLQAWLPYTGKGIAKPMRRVLEVKAEQAAYELARALRAETERREAAEAKHWALWESSSSMSMDWEVHSDAMSGVAGSTGMSFGAPALSAYSNGRTASDSSNEYGQYGDYVSACSGNADAVVWNNGSTALQGSSLDAGGTGSSVQGAEGMQSGGYAAGRGMGDPDVHEWGVQQWDEELFGGLLLSPGGGAELWDAAVEGADWKTR
jgi:hypothetical protein